MKWNTIRYNCNALFANSFENGQTTIDRKQLIKIVTDEFPEISQSQVIFVVNDYLNNTTESFSSTDFVSFLQEHLV